MKTLKDFNFKGKRVLVRCDFNVPLDKEGNILDDFRIKKSIETIEYLIKKEAKVILMSHLGKPEGKVVERLKMDKIQESLTEHLDLSVVKASDCIGKNILKYKMEEGEVLLLENLRFHKGEENGSLNFAKSLSKNGDIYVNDAFGVSHRDHASITKIPLFLPSCLGFLFQREIDVLKKIIEKPSFPMISIIGGTKVETKIKPINRILESSDFLLVGNLIAEEIRNKNISFGEKEKIVFPQERGDKLDMGEKTLSDFEEKINKAKTIFWNGPLGKIEEEEFSKGTKKIAELIIGSGAFSVVGGGETVEFLNRVGLISKFNHVSTGGGAMLDFIGHLTLPGLEALKNGNKKS